MAQRLTVLSIGRHTRLRGVLAQALAGIEHTVITPRSLPQAGLQGRHVLFAVSVDEYGMIRGMQAVNAYLRKNADAMEGCVAGVLLDGATELYTKAVARALIFDANRAGCTFIARALVEATKWLRNFHVLSRIQQVDCETAYQTAASDLVQRLLCYTPSRSARPSVLMLHASNRTSSNTLTLGLATMERLQPYCDITEVSLHNGAVYDCNGCPHKACTHYAEQKTCFYGGVVPETVFPAIEKSDAAILCVPNYNDAPGAYFLALNNRLNALMLRETARVRALFAIVVSGYSGGDLVAQQILGGFCLNKAFALPPRFALLETANDPDAIMADIGIAERLDAYSENIRAAICLPQQ